MLIWLLFYKAQILIWHYFHKGQILIWHYFHKGQILIWHYFHKAQIIIWYYFHNAQIIIWQLFHKTQNTILAKTITLCSMPKCYFGSYLRYANIISTLALHILSPSLMGNIITQKYFFHKIHRNYAYFPMIN